MLWKKSSLIDLQALEFKRIFYRAHMIISSERFEMVDMSLTTLANMQPGEVGCICGFHRGNWAYRRKLLAMGLTPNTRFQVLRRAPLGDPVQIQVHDYSLSIRQQEADLLKIERVKPLS